jgi:hypothetical protein
VITHAYAEDDHPTKKALDECVKMVINTNHANLTMHNGNGLSVEELTQDQRNSIAWLGQQCLVQASAEVIECRRETSAITMEGHPVFADGR